MYLYPNKSVLEFYPKFGFAQLREPSFSFNLKPAITTEPKTRKLNIHSPEDWKPLLKLYTSRIPISSQCGVLSAEGIFTWYCLNVFSNDIYYLEGLNTVVVYQQEGHLLHLYDVVSAHEVRLSELMKLLPLQGVDKVIVHYQPDDQDIDIQKFYNNSEDPLFIYPINVKMNSDMKLPQIAKA